MLSRILLAAFCSPILGQDQQKPAPATDSNHSDGSSSLAAAARNVKAQKSADVEKVFTDEDMDATGQVHCRT